MPRRKMKLELYTINIPTATHWIYQPNKCEIRGPLKDSYKTFVHHLQTCRTISWSKKTVQIYSPDTMFDYAFRVNSTSRVLITLSQSHNIPLSRLQLIKVSSKSLLPVRSYGSDTNLLCMQSDLRSFTLEDCVKYHLIPINCEKLWPGHKSMLCKNPDLDLGNKTLSQSADTPYVINNN